MKIKFAPLLLALILALGCCLPSALANSAVSNELNVPVDAGSRGVETEISENDLKLSILLSPSTVKPGGTVKCTITLTNNGASTVEGLTLAGTMPAEATSSGSLSEIGFSLGSGETKTVSFDAVLPVTLGNHTFSASAEGSPDIEMTTSANATVVGESDIALSISASPTTPKPGAAVTYTIALENKGDAGVFGLELTNTLPIGMTVLDADIMDGGARTGQQIKWSVDVPAKSTATVQFKGTIPQAATIGAVYTNTAAVPELELSGSASVTVTNYLVSLSSGASASRVRAGDSVQFTATLRNAGNLTTGTAQLTSAVPSGLSVSSISNGGTLSGQQISWTGVQLTAGASVTYSFWGTIPANASAGTDYTVSSSIIGEGISLSDYVSVRVYEDEPDLSIKKSVNNRTPEPGASVRYTITVYNDGGADAEDVTVIDTLPDGLEIVRNSISDGGRYQSNRDRIVWTVDVPADDKVRLTFRVWVPEDAEDGDVYVNRAYIEDGDRVKATFVVTEDAVPKTGETDGIIPAAWWKIAPNWGTKQADAPDGDNIPDEPLPPVQQAFSQLYAQNNELMGWLKVADIVDLPVMQTGNNDFYMQHDFSGKANDAGTLFLDERNTVIPADRNLLIYGHNMKSGAMFGQLSKYRSLDYLKANPLIAFQTIYDAEPTYYVVVAVLDASMDVGHKDYLKIRKPNFDDEADQQEYLGSIKTCSYFDTPVAFDETDPLLTLVTCSYYQDNGRLLVVARPLREGETLEETSALIAQTTLKATRT